MTTKRDRASSYSIVFPGVTFVPDQRLCLGLGRLLPRLGGPAMSISAFCRAAVAWAAVVAVAVVAVVVEVVVVEVVAMVLGISLDRCTILA